MALFCTHQSLSTVRDSSGHHELDVDDYKTDINVAGDATCNTATSVMAMPP